MIAPCAEQVKPSSPIGFRFRAVPSEVMAYRTLSSTAKLLFAAIADAARGTVSGLCKIANATLADRIGRSESEVGRCILELEAAGLVRREFGQSKNVRVGVADTWTETVPQERGTEHPSVQRMQGTGSASTGNPVPQGSGPSRPPALDPIVQTPILSLSSEEEPEERKPTPAEVAAAMRAMVAGRYAPSMFNAVGPASSTSPAGDRAAPAPSHGAPDPRPLFGRIGIDARAAAWRRTTSRQTAAQQIDELKRRSAARSARPTFTSTSPPPLPCPEGAIRKPEPIPVGAGALQSLSACAPGRLGAQAP